MQQIPKILPIHRLRGAGCAIATSALALAVSAVAQTTWTGAVSDAFTDAGNWDAGVPTTGVDAVIDNGFLAVIGASDTVDFNALTLTGTELDINGGNASLTGAVNLVGASILNVTSGNFSTTATDSAMYIGTTALTGTAMLSIYGNSETDFGTVSIAGGLSLSRGNYGGAGQIYLDGYGKLSVGQNLDVGRDGNSAGLLSMSGHSELTVTSLYVARNSIGNNRLEMAGSSKIYSTNLAVGEYASYTTGTLTMSDDSQIVNSGGEVYIGDNNQATGTLEMYNQTNITVLGDTRKFVIGRYNGTGSVTVNDNASITIESDFVVGENSGYDTTTLADKTSTLTITGEGALVQTGVGKSFYIGSGNYSTDSQGHSKGLVTLENGTIDTNGGKVIIGLKSYGTGSLAMNGGILKTAGFEKGAGVATVTFNGGTVQASTGGEFFTGFTDTDLTISNGGLKFDTNSSDVSISTAMTGEGGLTKQGAGMLTLSAANTFTGESAVSAGTLQISLTGSLAAIRLDIANDATLEIDNNISLNDEIVLSLATGSEFVMDFDGTETVGALWVDGVALAPDEYTLEELTSLGSGVTFSGEEGATVLVTGTVPEPQTVAMLLLGGATILLTLRRSRA